VIIAQVNLRFNLSRGTLLNILHERLGYTVCSRGIPCHLIDEHKKTLIGAFLMIIQRYEDHGEAFLRRIVTKGETWFLHYLADSKTGSMTWMHPHPRAKKKFKTVQSPGKMVVTVFWDVCGVLLVISHLPVQQ
jgi:hypothetical protein